MVVVKGTQQNFSRKDAPIEVTVVGELYGRIQEGKFDVYGMNLSIVESQFPFGTIMDATLVLHRLRKGKEVGVSFGNKKEEAGIRKLQSQVMIKIRKSLSRFYGEIDEDFVLYVAARKIESWNKQSLQKALLEIGESNEEALRFLIKLDHDYVTESQESSSVERDDLSKALRRFIDGEFPKGESPYHSFPHYQEQGLDYNFELRYEAEVESSMKDEFGMIIYDVPPAPAEQPVEMMPHNYKHPVKPREGHYVDDFDIEDTIDNAFEGQADLWEAWRDG